MYRLQSIESLQKNTEIGFLIKNCKIQGETMSYYHTFKGALLAVCIAGLLVVCATESSKAGEKDKTCSPEITDWSPKIEEIYTRRPIITVTFRSDCGTNIDISSIKMIVDKEEAYPEISGGGSEVKIAFQPYLELSYDCTVTVSVQDVNGQKVEKTWMFEVPYWVGQF